MCVCAHEYMCVCIESIDQGSLLLLGSYITLSYFNVITLSDYYLM